MLEKYIFLELRKLFLVHRYHTSILEQMVAFGYQNRFFSETNFNFNGYFAIQAKLSICANWSIVIDPK